MMISDENHRKITDHVAGCIHCKKLTEVLFTKLEEHYKLMESLKDGY